MKNASKNTKFLKEELNLIQVLKLIGGLVIVIELWLILNK